MIRTGDPLAIVDGLPTLSAGTSRFLAEVDFAQFFEDLEMSDSEDELEEDVVDTGHVASLVRSGVVVSFIGSVCTFLQF